MKNSEYIKELGKNKSSRTQRGYQKVLTDYSNYHKLSLDQLINEAISNEEQSLIHAKKELRERITSYQNHLQNITYTRTNQKQYTYKNSTINNQIRNIKTFYRHYDITVPPIKDLSYKDKERFEDRVTQEQLTQVIQNIGNIRHKALITVMSSSGIPSKDILKLTKMDLVKATKDYHNLTDINDVIPYLLQLNTPIIPTWNYIRSKTGIEVITFSSPESTRYLLEYLNQTMKHDNKDKLFNYTYYGVKGVYEMMNTRFYFGKTSIGRNKFHAHAMRSFFSTQLLAADMDSLLIEFLMGHKIPDVTASYYSAKPEHLKKKYIRVVDSLSTTPVKVTDIKSSEYLELERENQNMKENIESIVEEAMRKHDQELQGKRKDMSIDDLFKDF